MCVYVCVGILSTFAFPLGIASTYFDLDTVHYGADWLVMVPNMDTRPRFPYIRGPGKLSIRVTIQRPVPWCCKDAVSFAMLPGLSYQAARAETLYDEVFVARLSLACLDRAMISPKGEY